MFISSITQEQLSEGEVAEGVDGAGVDGEVAGIMLEHHTRWLAVEVVAPPLFQGTMVALL